MRATLAAIVIAGGFGLGVAGAANAGTVMLNFTGACADCTGTGVGTLTLQNLPSGPLTKDDFVSFIYKSNLVSFQINSSDIISVMGSINPNDLGKTYIDILQLGGTGWEFDRNADGTWSVSNQITFGMGTSEGTGGAGGGGGGGGGDGGGPVVGMGLTHASAGGDGSGQGADGGNSSDGAGTQTVVDDFGGSSDLRLVAGVPEPESWALMIVGFAGMGALLRNRRRVAPRTASGIETA
jgi:hypothetical protein